MSENFQPAPKKNQAYQRDYYAKNRETLLAYQRDYYAKNRDKIKKRDREREARKRDKA